MRVALFHLSNQFFRLFIYVEQRSFFRNTLARFLIHKDMIFHELVESLVVVVLMDAAQL